MSRVTCFAARDPGPAARLSGFMAHLRENGWKLGLAETELALAALAATGAPGPATARLALKAVCAGSAEEAARFDEAFDAYWLNGGRVMRRAVPFRHASPHVRSSLIGEGEAGGGAGATEAPDGGEGEAEAEGEGKLAAVGFANLMKKDLREIVRPEDVAEAEALARRLGAALNDRRSRRRKATAKGERIHFRRLMRQCLSTGGEPFRLPMTRRPDRPLRIAALCDVSGSMAPYARAFLAFLAGLMRADANTGAWLFHTRLVPISDALREPDPMRAVARLSLMAEGFGGGSKIGSSLASFARGHVRRSGGGRTVVLILSDGYDTGPPELIAAALEAISRRGSRIIWLNPLKGWRGYEPVAHGMAAALPHLDLFRAANTLADLAALEPELARL